MVLKGVLWKWNTIVINKADDNIRKAQLAKSEFNRALHLFQQKAGFTTATCSAITRRDSSLGNHHEIYRTHEKQ
jgi:LAO/AO transport system kinase